MAADLTMAGKRIIGDARRVVGAKQNTHGTKQQSAGVSGQTAWRSHLIIKRDPSYPFWYMARPHARAWENKTSPALLGQGDGWMGDVGQRTAAVGRPVCLFGAELN